MSESNRKPAEKRVWDRYVDEPFRSRVARQSNPPQITDKSALIVVDLYNLVYQGGNKPVSELINQFPASCGEHAYRAIEPINRTINLFRSRDLPIFFSTKDFERSQQSGNATHRPRNRPKSEDYEIYPAIDFRATDELVKNLRPAYFSRQNYTITLKDWMSIVCSSWERVRVVASEPVLLSRSHWVIRFVS
jgi:hypothetical protein